jgi:hypothetical protein
MKHANQNTRGNAKVHIDPDVRVEVALYACYTCNQGPEVYDEVMRDDAVFERYLRHSEEHHIDWDNVQLVTTPGGGLPF